MARLVFLGTPASAVLPLEALVQAGHDLVLVVSRPDRRRRRGRGAEASPVKAAALRLGLSVAERVEAVMDTDAELGVVVAFGQLVHRPVLEHLPMVNLHFSLLPRWRGAAPVERAVLAGDEETGVCVMSMDEGLDTGPVHDCARVAIGPDEHADHLRDRLAELGTAMLVERLARGLASLGPSHPQVGEPTYAAKLGPADLRLDWSRPALELGRVVRVGRAWTLLAGRRFLVHRALPHSGQIVAGPPGTIDGVMVATGQGAFELVQVQPEGRPSLAARDWARGARLPSDAVLGR